MNLRHAPSGTLDAGLLVRYLHGELDPSVERSVAVHIDTCVACRSVVESLEEGMRRTSVALRTAAHDQPEANEWIAVLDRVHAGMGHRVRAKRMRVAAGWILALAGAASIASSPVRGWIAERLATIAGDDSSAAIDRDATRGGMAAFTFVPAGSHLEIVVDSIQAAGSLTVRFTDGDNVDIGVSGGATEHLTWSRNGIRIANVPLAAASYVVSVSHGVERVSVRVAGADPIELSRHEQGKDTVDIALETGAVRKPASRDEQ
ncbi:MAG TPA: zf-HC2 domain-containing protein [Longimicrobiales bacterium]|nr:zf-HC2 domain-containing protein [Longimicrobiales bacterium]